MDDRFRLRQIFLGTQEKRHGAFEHGVLGEIASAIWGLPTFCSDAMAQHHTLPNVFDSSSITVIDSVALGAQLCHWMTLQPSRIETGTIATLREKFKLTERQLNDLADELAAKAQPILAFAAQGAVEKPGKTA